MEGTLECVFFEQFAVVKLMLLMNDYTLERQQTNQKYLYKSNNSNTRTQKNEQRNLERWKIWENLSWNFWLICSMVLNMCEIIYGRNNYFEVRKV